MYFLASEHLFGSQSLIRKTLPMILVDKQKNKVLPPAVCELVHVFFGNEWITPHPLESFRASNRKFQRGFFHWYSAKKETTFLLFFLFPMEDVTHLILLFVFSLSSFIKFLHLSEIRWPPFYMHSHFKQVHLFGVCKKKPRFMFNVASWEYIFMQAPSYL